MNEYKIIETIKSCSITIDLPPDFQGKKVTVTVQPFDDIEYNKQTLQEILLKAPTLTDAELEEYNVVRDWMNQWNLNKF